MADSKLDSNLVESKHTCTYLLKTVTMAGANWDQYSGSRRSWENCLNQKRDRKACEVYKDSVDICVYDKTRPAYEKIAKGKSMIDRIRVIAATAVKNKCGNCGEFSAGAFIHLLDKKVRPLDWCSLKGADHAFVIIGRASGDVDDYATWGDAAAICDAWAQGFRKDAGSGTYAGSNFKKQMGGLLTFSGVNIMHRVE